MISFIKRFWLFSLALVAMSVIAVATLADTSTIVEVLPSPLSSVFVYLSQKLLADIVSVLSAVLFFDIYGFPFLVAWLVVGGVFFTFRLGFINIRLFGHGIAAVSGKYSSGNEPGEISHFQALTAAVSGTVGLGNIAGVAIAITIGGPGAVIWMAIAGLFGMSTKFAEVMLGQKYRRINKKGRTSGGAFYYLQDGLKEIGKPRIGKALAVIFACCCIAGSIGAGNMFQANQTIAILSSFDVLSEFDRILAVVLAVSVGIVLIGGIKRIAVVAEAVVPLMALIYMSAGLVILFVNAAHIPEAFSTMIHAAFSFDAAGGGIVGAIIAGFKRASFSNEAGLGSAPIAHSAAKTDEPVREGCVALLEPFIDTVIICMMTGLIITVSGVYTLPQYAEETGVVLTSHAFSTVIEWFPIVLAFAVVMFAYSTIITWSYYGERSWIYLFGDKRVGLFHIFFICGTLLGGLTTDLGLIVDFSDLMILSMAIPNLIGLYFLQGMVYKELQIYLKKLKNGEFKTYKVIKTSILQDS